MFTAVKDWIKGRDNRCGNGVGTNTPQQRRSRNSEASSISCIILDDHAPTRNLISAAISELGATTAHFDTVDDLLSLLEDCTPGLIFLDVALRDSDAIEAIRGLGERKYNGMVQLISAQSDHVLAEVHAIGVMRQLRMLPPIRKPCSIQKFREIARTHLRPSIVGGASAQPAVDLDLALRRDWVEVWYQPKIDLRRRTLVGVEALSRVNHPQFGIVPPSRFLSNASAAAVAELTEHVIVTTLKDWGRIRDTGFVVKAAVNVSVECLERVPIAKLLRRNRPTASDWPGFMLELTEEQVVKDLNKIRELAIQMKLYDAVFSIDDFGSGYSSFNRLKQIPFAEIKLDGSYVQGCANDRKSASICKAIIDLAHCLGAQAVAECVEDRDDLMTLYNMGCDLAQGYLLCRPLPLPELITLLKRKAGSETGISTDPAAQTNALEHAGASRAVAHAIAHP